MCKVCSSDLWIKQAITQAYIEGKSIRDISYFLRLFMDRHIGKDTLYRHFRLHDAFSFQERTAYFQFRASKSKRTYPKKPDPVEILKAMR